MRHLTRVSRLAPLMIVALSVLSFSAAAVAGSDSRQAMVVPPDDPRLEWGPCPGFMPQGCRIAVLQGDPAKKNADIFFKIPPATDIPRHWHTSAERMVLVAGELRLNYDGQQPLVMRPGSYAYGPAERAHAGRCAAGEPCVLFIAFEQPVDAIPGAKKAH